jgi:hypothetical protein
MSTDEDTDIKFCKTCGLPKPIDEYYRNGNYADGRLPDCKECSYRKRQAAEVKKNLEMDYEGFVKRREEQKEYHRQYYAAKKVGVKGSRAAKANITAIIEALERTDRTCAECGKQVPLHSGEWLWVRRSNFFGELEFVCEDHPRK